MLRDIPYRPGVSKDDPAYTSQGYATDSAFIRWANGYAWSMDGWELVSAGTSSQKIVGFARGMHTWALLNGQALAAIGTNQRLYVYDGTEIYDITPQRSSGTFSSNPFTTTSGSSTVSVALTNHSALPGDTVFIGGGTAVGGVMVGGPTASMSANSIQTLSGASIVYVYINNHGAYSNDIMQVSSGTSFAGIQISGNYLVTVVDANTMTIDAGSLATASTAGGGTPPYTIFHSYVIQSTPDANDFTVIAYSTATASTSGGGTPSFIFEINSGAADGTAGAGYGTGTYGTGLYGSPSTGPSYQPRTWSFAHFGQNLLGCYYGGPLYQWVPNFSQPASPLSGSPSQVNIVVVTPERFILACGCTDVSGVYDPMVVRWNDNQNTTGWTPANGNLAGFLRLSEGSMVVAAKPTKGGTLVWTNTALYFLYYTYSIDALYEAVLLGTGCGAMGPNACIDQDGLALWVSAGSQFYIYNGGAPRPLPNPNRLFFQENLASGQGYKTYCRFDTLYTAVEWYYATSTNECDSYERLDVLEAAQDDNAGWSVGPTFWTALVDRGVFSVGLACGEDGNIYGLNQGNGSNNAALNRFVTWAPVELPDPDHGNGNHLVQIRRLLPDVDILSGGPIYYTMAIQRWPNGQTVTKGPYAFTSATQYIDVRGVGRQMSLTVATSGNNDQWRHGVMRGDMSEGPLR